MSSFRGGVISLGSCVEYEAEAESLSEEVVTAPKMNIFKSQLESSKPTADSLGFPQDHRVTPVECPDMVTSIQTGTPSIIGAQESET